MTTSGPSSGGSALRLVLRAVWIRWKAIAHRFANFQARVILSLFYFVVLGPFAVAMKMCSDPLALASPQPTRWTPRRGLDVDLSLAARRQF